MNISGDTIAAIATAPGRSGVAVVRVSGPDALGVAERVTGRRPEASSIRVDSFRDPLRDAVVDSGITLAFRSPHSYTGEDVVEFQCHGGSVTPRRVLEAAFAAGARLARRGEFTERAFLNGKLDYDQADSVLALIDARTDRAADVALQGIAGRRKRMLDGLYSSAVSLSAELEHALDVDEDELPASFFDDMRRLLETLRKSVAEAIAQMRKGKILRDGVLVVLSGPPNVGKSSLMNALLGENRAIVSDVPGTTRDSIEEGLNVDGWPVRIVDTAGLRTTGDEIEAEGVRRAEELVARADVVLRLVDSPPPTDCDNAGKAVLVRTKSDLLADDERGRWRERGFVTVSALSGEGLDDLRTELVRRFEAMAECSGESSHSSEDIAGLTEVLSQLNGVGSDVTTDPVLAANVVRTAAVRLGELVGATYSSDLLDRLFSRFCVGK